MLDARQTSPGSNMPNYPWLFEKFTDYGSLPAKINVQKMLGVPFPDWSPAEIDSSAKAQAKAIKENLESLGKDVDADTQIVALIAYLQQLGKSINVQEQVVNK